MARTSGDSGVTTTPTARLSVFATGMPASTAAADRGVATTTVARPDVSNPIASLFTNPPSATSDIGSA